MKRKSTLAERAYKRAVTPPKSAKQIGGKRYSLLGHYATKSSANNHAKMQRSRGNKARVVKKAGTNPWYVYIA